MNTRQCPGCKTTSPLYDYPADNRYGVLSPECRATFDEILVKEGELFGYPEAHRLIVDAYWVQHPPHSKVQEELGISKRFVDASIQSIGIHLIALYLAIEKKIALKNIGSRMDHILNYINKHKLSFERLESPCDLGVIKALDVKNVINTKSLTLKEYTNLAWSWAESVWQAWSKQHKTVQNWYEKYSEEK